MSTETKRKKVGIDLRWFFLIAFFAGLYYLTKLSGLTSDVVIGLGLLSAGVLGFVLISTYYPRKFDYFSLAEIIDMNLAPESRTTYEAFAVFMVRKANPFFYYGGLIGLLSLFVTRLEIVGWSHGRITVGWLGLMLVLILVTQLLGWNQIAERRARGKQ